MKLGNIVCDTEINLGYDMNIVNSIDDIDPSLPTLIIGYHIVKKVYGEDINFLERQIDGIFWTFTKEEHRKYHIIDTNDFINHIFETMTSKINYVFVDPIQYKLKSMKKIITKIKSLKDPISYVLDNKIVYMYAEDLVFGIDLDLLEFIGIQPSKIKSKIKAISKVFLEDDSIFIEYKNYIDRLENQVKYIPFIYSIIKNE